MTDRPPLLTTRALAAALDVHPQTIRRWTRARTIRAATHTAGGYPRFDLAQVQQQLGEAQGDRKAGEHRPTRPVPEVPEVPEPPTERVPFLEWLDRDPGSRAAAQAVIDTVGRLITDKRAPYGTVSHARRRVDQLRATYGIPRPTL